MRASPMAADEPGGIVSASRDITAAWLTTALHAAGHLTVGSAATLSVQRHRRKTLSALYRLEATYTHPTVAPASFILKVGRAENTSSMASRRRWKEHAFYTQVAPVMDDPPVPR